MFYRFAVCAAIALLAYYVGREIGRTEPVRNQMNAARTRRAGTVPPEEAELHNS